jgi:hypothetical protein
MRRLTLLSVFLLSYGLAAPSLAETQAVARFIGQPEHSLSSGSTAGGTAARGPVSVKWSGEGYTFDLHLADVKSESALYFVPAARCSAKSPSQLVGRLTRNAETGLAMLHASIDSGVAPKGSLLGALHILADDGSRSCAEAKTDS